MSKSIVSRPRVYVRIRPLNERENKEGKGEIICHGDQWQKDVLYLKSDDGTALQTRFDHVFGAETTQKEVFDLIGPEVKRTLFSGYNATVFAYGQTGSGKTHTMEGDRTAGEGGGIMPALIHCIFAAFSENTELTCANVEMSVVQIYQEKIQDLLNARKGLDIHMNRTGEYVARDVTWRKVCDVRESMKRFAEASKSRATTSTDMNMVSSRSHMIMSIRMQWDEPTLPGCRAQLNVVDLAGSERLNESGATGAKMAEAIHINKSLSALANVIIKLVEAAKNRNRRVHIPYKDSKLTYLLQSSLGGANLVHFILAVSGSKMWRSETSSTIEFGKRALQLVLRPVRNAVDYTRLAEMEAMIERMRSQIASLEEELQNKNVPADAGFLQIQKIAQVGEEAPAPKRRRGDVSRTRAHLKRQTELARIMNNLPETFDDLTSHCVLFPESKRAFYELGGLEKLVHFVAKSSSYYYRSNAAHTVASVIDDVGREAFAGMGGIEALSGLLQVKEERCKEAACVALDAVCRGCLPNKEALTPVVYTELVDLIYGYPNQQVEEVACAAVASIVDAFPGATRQFEKLDVVPKLLETIRTAPDEVVNLTKAATNCIGRLAHGDVDMQRLIASFGGIDLLIDVLFSPGGGRDHQVPILASYALVNLCCSNADNVEIAKEHPRYAEVKFRLLEGLARAFGTNVAREGFGRATAQETTSPFPYFGVTIQDKWGVASSGGRPIFSSFMDNPQFYLYVEEPTDVAFIIQDTLYEARMRKKRRNHAVYMGLAIFEADPDVAKSGLKQLDFHGRMIEISKYTSNCENVLHCSLQPSETPYVVVPFTSQRGRSTEFALSAFGDKRIELTAVPEHVGWVHTTIDGCWTEFTGRSGEGFDWRCNSQILITPRENCRVVFVLSYRSLDEQRAAWHQEEDISEHNTRPRLHGRLFTHDFAPPHRYLKALVPLPQGSTFVASNIFASNSYVTSSASLKKGQTYAYVPFTETPFQDTWRVSVYCDTDDASIAPLASQANEWLCTSFSGVWEGKAVSIQLEVKGKLMVIASSPGTFVRVSLLDNKGQKLAGIDSYWNSEASASYQSRGAVLLQVEGMVRTEGRTPGGKAQEPARDRKFDLFIFSEKPCQVDHVSFPASPSALPYPTCSTAASLLQYPVIVDDTGAPLPEDCMSDEEVDSRRSAAASDDLEQSCNLEATVAENRDLKMLLERQQQELAQLRGTVVLGAAMPPAGELQPDGTTTPTSPTCNSNTTNGDHRVNGVSDVVAAIQYAVQKLTAVEKRCSAEVQRPTKEGCKRLLKDIRSVQQRLTHALDSHGESPSNT